MTDEAFTEAVDVVQRRIARVRRRHGLREVARVACVLVAVGSLGAAVGLTLALHAGARAFTIVAWLLAIAVPPAVLVVIVLAWQRRLGRERAAGWIDQRAGLGGRLATLVELAKRGPRDAFFLALLVEQNLDRLPAWPPARLVPQIAPRREIVVALAGLAALALAVVLAPASRPRLASNQGSGRSPRDVVATNADATPTNAVPGTAVDRNQSAGLAVAIQNRLRDAMWGDDWAELPAAATARTERAPDRRDPRRPSDDAQRAALRADDQMERGTEASPPDAEPAHADERQDAVAEGAPGSGAGTGTDPHLLGDASEPTDGRTTFELALGARVRARRQRPQRSPDEAPPAEPDARPALGAGERRVAAVHRMPVPAAYEAIVRAAFGHHAAEETSP